MILNVTKKLGFTLSSENTFLEKSQGDRGGQFDAPPRITTDRIYCIYNKTNPLNFLDSKLIIIDNYS